MDLKESKRNKDMNVNNLFKSFALKKTVKDSHKEKG